MFKIRKEIEINPITLVGCKFKVAKSSTIYRIDKLKDNIYTLSWSRDGLNRVDSDYNKEEVIGFFKAGRWKLV